MPTFSKREIATIIPALEIWKDELTEGKEWIDESDYFEQETPLSVSEIGRLIDRLRKSNKAIPKCKGSTSESWQCNVVSPTYYGHRNSQKTSAGDGADFADPHVPILIAAAAGIRLVLGTHDFEDCSKPDVQVERRPNGWSLFIHPEGGDPVASVFILDDGHTFLLHEPSCATPLQTVQDVPIELDWT